MDKMNNAITQDVEISEIFTSTDCLKQISRKIDKDEQPKKVVIENRNFNFFSELEKFKKLEDFKNEEIKVEKTVANENISKMFEFEMLLTFFEKAPALSNNKKINYLMKRKEELKNERKNTRILFSSKNCLNLIQGKRCGISKSNDDAKPFDLLTSERRFSKTQSNIISKINKYNFDLNIAYKQLIKYEKAYSNLNSVKEQSKMLKQSKTGICLKNEIKPQINSNNNISMLERSSKQKDINISAPPNKSKALHCINVHIFLNILKNSKNVCYMEYINNEKVCNFCILIITFENLCSAAPIHDLLPVNLKKVNHIVKSTNISTRNFKYELIRKMYEK